MGETGPRALGARQARSQTAKDLPHMEALEFAVLAIIAVSLITAILPRRGGRRPF